MRQVTLSDQQLKDLFGCIDLALRTEGLSSLQRIVSLHNALLAAEPVEVKEDAKEDPKKPEGT